MVTWIVFAMVVAALLILVLAVVPVARRLPGFLRAAARLQQRQGEMVALQHSAEQLQERMLTLQDQAEDAQRRLAAINAKRDQ